MVSLSLTSFMLVLLFIFLTLKVSIAHTDQAKQIFVEVHEAENGFAMELAGSYQSVEKEVLDGVPAAAVLTTGRMVGRKMMIERRNTKQGESVKTEEDSKNSGNNNGSANLFGNSRKDLHHQDQSCYESTRNKNSRKPANGNSSGNSLNKLDQTDNSKSFQKLESEKLLEDATEVLNMMNKDYSGGPGSGSKPRHKPPINNYQPFHRSNP